MIYVVIATAAAAFIGIVYIARAFIWPWYVEYLRLKSELASAETTRYVQIDETKIKAYDAETRRFEVFKIKSGYGEYSRETLVLPGEEMYPAPLGYIPRESIATTYSPRYNISQAQAPAQIAAPIIEIPTLARGMVDFLDCMDLIEPGKMILGLAPHAICVNIADTLHGALAGSTGKGKTVIERLLMLQYILLAVKVYLADPHFAPVDPKSGDDWRPFLKHLAAPPARSYDEIEQLLCQIATVELPARYQKRFEGKLSQPIVIFVDELAQVIHKRPKVAQYMTDILREARKVDIYFIGAAQDMLVKTLGVNGGVRENFLTAFYVGGDATTARIILDLPPKAHLDEANLGKGLAMLRSAATPDATLVRIPYVSNETLYKLLGRPEEKALPERPFLTIVRSDQEGAAAPTPERETREAAARRLWTEGFQSVRVLGEKLAELGYTGTSNEPITNLIKKLDLTKDSFRAEN